MRLLSCTLGFILAATSVARSLSPNTELVVPAAARSGPWVTDLYLLNLGDGPTDVSLGWLVRGQPNPEPSTATLVLADGETRVLEDVVGSLFGLGRGEGAIYIVATQPIVANCRIHAATVNGTVGQGFAGVPLAAAIASGGSTDVVGLTASAAFRSNVYAVAGADGVEMNLNLRDPTGATLDTSALSLAGWQPMLQPLTELFDIAEVADATLHVEVTAGAVVVGGSRVDNASTDPTTLESWISRTGNGLAAGTHHGIVLRHDTAAAGGIILVVNGSGELKALEFSFPSERCPLLFAAGRDLSAQPLPLVELADGFTFSSDYPAGGVMQWTLVLQPANGAATGTLAALGTGWSGESAACNGVHQPKTVTVGTEIR